MDTLKKSPVEVVQELIAIHTTRKEITEKMLAKQNGGSSPMLEAAGKQSDAFISALMNELSNYGDGVMATVERENEYHRLWKNALESFEALSPKDADHVFVTLENCLKKHYAQELESQADLPQTLVQLLNQQSGQLQSQSGNSSSK